MKKWLNEVVLETDNVKLLPICENHKDDLITASLDGNLSELWFASIPTKYNIDIYIAKAIEDFKQDKGLAFVVINKKINRIIGTTRFTNATPEHRRLEIGYTWYSKTFQKTHINSECKLLLLSHAFETLKTVAVEFRTNWYNFPSRNAIERLGAKQDGVLRNHQIMPNGSFRDTVVFSILESEWQTCKQALLYKINQMHNKANY